MFVVSCSVMSNFLWPRELKHARLPYFSLSPRACSKAYPLTPWYHPTISFSVTPFFSCPQSFAASGSFPMNCSSHQVAKALSFNFSISPSNEYSGFISFRMVWFDILAVQGTLKSFLQHHSSKAIFPCSDLFIVCLLNLEGCPKSWWILFQKHVCVLVAQLCLTLCNPTLCPWNSPRKNTGVVCHSLLQGIFPI